MLHFQLNFQIYKLNHSVWRQWIPFAHLFLLLQIFGYINNKKKNFFFVVVAVIYMSSKPLRMYNEYTSIYLLCVCGIENNNEKRKFFEGQKGNFLHPSVAAHHGHKFCYFIFFFARPEKAKFTRTHFFVVCFPFVHFLRSFFCPFPSLVCWQEEDIFFFNFKHFRLNNPDRKEEEKKSYMKNILDGNPCKLIVKQQTGAMYT